jgi:hypothetical protein
MFITSTEAKVQDFRQAQMRQRSEIQIGAKVQDGRQAQGQAEWSGGQGQERQGSKTRRVRKREARKRQELTGQTRPTG